MSSTPPPKSKKQGKKGAEPHGHGEPGQVSDPAEFGEDIQTTGEMLDGEAKSSFGPVLKWNTPGTIAVAVAAIAWFLMQAYMSFFPTAIPAVEQRAIHLAFGMALAGLVLAARTKSPIFKAAWYLAAVVGVAVEIYAMNEMAFQMAVGGLFEFPDFQVALVGLLLVSVFTGRIIGWILPVLGLIFVGAAMIGDFLPGIFKMVPSEPTALINKVYYGGDGVHGIPLDASNRYIFIFIVFGAFLTHFGASDFLVRIASKGLSTTRGGAGKMSVVASALFGVTSDSSTANVTTTGIITIPLMKRTGFTAERAAGIESAGAVGGLLVPPVMGSVAFIMVGVTGIPYHEILIAAIIPAILYYVALFISVDRLAARSRIGGFTDDSPPAGVRRNTLDSVEFGAPIVLLIYLLVIAHWEPSQAGVWALGLLILLHLLRFRNKAALVDCLKAAIVGPQRAVVVALITASVGVLIAPILISGLGLNLASGLLSIGAANVVLLLVVTMVASLALGSGLPASATYVFLAVLVAPSLVDFGFPVIVVHFFIMYFGTVSDLSPPTMATVYVASGIAESRPMASAGYAMAFGIAGFIVPFMFVFRPELLMVGGNFLNVPLAIVISLGALLLLISGIMGYGRRSLIWPVRVATIICGIGCVFPQLYIALPALVIGAGLALWSPGSRPEEPKPVSISKQAKMSEVVVS